MMLSRALVSFVCVFVHVLASTGNAGVRGYSPDPLLNHSHPYEPLSIPHLPLPAGVDPSLLKFKLSVTWPPGHCTGKTSGCTDKLKNVPHDFTLHGLWPIYTGGACKDSNIPFNYDAVRKLEPYLSQFWPKLDTYGTDHAQKGNIDFWTHEWDKHGKKCNLYSVEQYFKDSLYLLLNSNLLKIIKKAGYPDTPEKLREAFPSNMGPTTYCEKGLKDKKIYLSQIDFCISLKGNTFEYNNCKDVSAGPHCKDAHQQFSYGNIAEKMYVGANDLAADSLQETGEAIAM